MRRGIHTDADLCVHLAPDFLTKAALNEMQLDNETVRDKLLLLNKLVVETGVYCRFAKTLPRPDPDNGRPPNCRVYFTSPFCAK